VLGCWVTLFLAGHRQYQWHSRILKAMATKQVQELIRGARGDLGLDSCEAGALLQEGSIQSCVRRFQHHMLNKSEQHMQQHRLTHPGISNVFWSTLVASAEIASTCMCIIYFAYMPAVAVAIPDGDRATASEFPS
jgi:hypothetical protein